MTLALIAFVIAIGAWWLSTGVVIMIARARVAHPAFIVVPAIGLALVGMAGLFLSANQLTPNNVYIAFASVLAIWAFHEITFLTGLVVGPRRQGIDPQVHGSARFRLAFAAIRDHELALFVTGLFIVFFLSTYPNPTGAIMYSLLWLMRLSTKINVFLGAPNAVSDILPERLSYLTSYFRTDSVHAFFIISVVAITGLMTFGIFEAVNAISGGSIVLWSLFSSFAALALVEHMFLVLPIRDADLWGWALRGDAPDNHDQEQTLKTRGPKPRHI